MSFIITVGGMLFFAIVVGFVVDAIRARMEALKRGKSSVVETNHYLLLGWSDKSFSLIRELILAMESEGGGVIVILSERDKDEIEGEVREPGAGAVARHLRTCFIPCTAVRLAFPSDCTAVQCEGNVRDHGCMSNRLLTACG